MKQEYTVKEEQLFIYYVEYKNSSRQRKWRPFMSGVATGERIDEIEADCCEHHQGPIRVIRYPAY